jgi:hypothetical protein
MPSTRIRTKACFGTVNCIPIINNTEEWSVWRTLMLNQKRSNICLWLVQIRKLHLLYIYQHSNEFINELQSVRRFTAVKCEKY